jgi:hypothetical protein
VAVNRIDAADGAMDAVAGAIVIAAEIAAVVEIAMVETAAVGIAAAAEVAAVAIRMGTGASPCRRPICQPSATC